MCMKCGRCVVYVHEVWKVCGVCEMFKVCCV